MKEYGSESESERERDGEKEIPEGDEIDALLAVERIDPLS